MQIGLRVHQARKLAQGLYSGHSKPIADVKQDDRPHEIDWWESQPQDECPDTDRQRAAILLYLDLAAKSKKQLPADCFPAVFDCEGGSLRPDKAIIKAFLREDLINPQALGWQLVFDLTDAGRQYATEASERLLPR